MECRKGVWIAVSWVRCSLAYSLIPVMMECMGWAVMFSSRGALVFLTMGWDGCMLLERSQDWRWLDSVYAMQHSVRGNQNERFTGSGRCPPL